MIAMIVKSRRQMDLDINYLPPLTIEEHKNEFHPISETVTAKEGSSTEPDSESCIKDKEVTDLVVDKSSKELQIKEPEETNEAAKHPEPIGEGTEPKPEGKELMDEGTGSKDEGQEPTDDRKESEGSDIKSPTKNVSENPVESKASVKEEKAAKSEEVALKEHQRYSVSQPTVLSLTGAHIPRKFILSNLIMNSDFKGKGCSKLCTKPLPC